MQWIRQLITINNATCSKWICSLVFSISQLDKNPILANGVSAHEVGKCSTRHWYVLHSMTTISSKKPSDTPYYLEMLSSIKIHKKLSQCHVTNTRTVFIHFLLKVFLFRPWMIFNRQWEFTVCMTVNNLEKSFSSNRTAKVAAHRQRHGGCN